MRALTVPRLPVAPGARRRLLVIGVVVVLVAGLLVWAIVRNNTKHYRVDDFTFTSTTPSGTVKLDSSLWVPDGVTAGHPAPAVIVAHGFGGTKDSVAGDAEDLVARGYVVLTYSARGFGRSTGLISLDAPDGEVADTRNLIGYLSTQPEVVQDGSGDPRVGILGASYGGALALITAGYDRRVDAIVPEITWNRMSRVFFPNAAGDPDGTGVAAPARQTDVRGAFKREWAGIFFSFGKGFDATSLIGGTSGSAGASAGASGGADAPADPTGDGSSTGGRRPGAGGGAISDQALVCGKFTPEVCQVYSNAAASGDLDDAGLKVLDRSSPWSVAEKISAPTLLIQGQDDTLFPLSEADVTAQQVRKSGKTPVKVMWTSGGHDAGGVSGSDDELADIRTQIGTWLGHYLKKTGPAPSQNFTFTERTGLSAVGARAVTRVQTAPAYPGLDGAAVTRTNIPMSGGTQRIVHPAGGAPASITSLPGLGSIAGLSYDPPGQVALFTSAPLAAPVEMVGTARISLTIAGPSDPGLLYAKVYDAGPTGRPTLPGGQVVPIATLKLNGAGVDVVLPAIAYRFDAGHRIVVAIATTDRAYAPTTVQKIYTVSLASPALSVPTVASVAAGVATSSWVWLLVVLGAVALLAIIVGLIWRRVTRRRAIATVDASLLDVPLVVHGLHKRYDDGFVAVRGIDFTVQRNQVVGLLGPNGAGKTTALRMLMGLIRPTEGEMRVFGHEVKVGAPVLSRLGCFVEGVGFLPHLTGRENIELYWAAKGRPLADAGVDDVLRIAGLGAAIDRRVRTYSQGMKQRLAIAQAMLGRPDVLILDEPTNGLDPPQIAAMREVLRGYAVDGRSVLVSSHQLAEVEQTCTHVVVMNLGEVISSGTVDEVAGFANDLSIGVDDGPAAVGVVGSMDGVRVLDSSADEVAIEISDRPSGPDITTVVAALVDAGIGVRRVVPRRRLEDAFLALVGEQK